MRDFLRVIVLTIMLSAFILSGCAQTTPAPTPSKPAPATTTAPAPHKEVKISIWAGSFGGTFYTVGFPFMNVLNKTHPWLRGSIIETKGAWDNLFNSMEDKAQMPFALVTSDYSSYRDIISGTATQWTKAGMAPAKPEDRLIICAISNAAQFVVTFDPNIKNGKDLVGKKMAGYTRGSGAYETLAQMLAQWGITEKDLKSYDGMELKAKADALMDGLVDAIYLSEPFMPGKPDLVSSSLAQLKTNPRPLYCVPTTKEEAQAGEAKWKAANKYFMPWKEIPAGHFNKSWPAQGTTFVYQVYWVYKEMSEEIQYEITKTLIEQSDAIAAHGAQAALMIPSVMVGGLPITSEAEMAPGALKYYKESGIWSKYPPPFLRK